MQERCPNCSKKFEPEPGFYYGAMFLSYIISAFFSLAFVGICILGFGMTVELSFLLLIVLAIFSYLWFFRFSRSLWINLMVKYDANYKIIK